MVERWVRGDSVGRDEGGEWEMTDKDIAGISVNE